MLTSSVKYEKNLRTAATHLQSESIIHTDAPTDNNGKGEKFSPTDLVATALASCAITVMGITAEKHQIPYQNIEASVEKIMAAEPRRIDVIKIVFRINEKLDEKQKLILERAAYSCPVAKSLSEGLKQDFSFVYL